MKEKLLIIVKIVAVITICGGLIFGVYSCENKKKKKEAEKELIVTKHGGRGFLTLRNLILQIGMSL